MDILNIPNPTPNYISDGEQIAAAVTNRPATEIQANVETIRNQTEKNLNNINAILRHYVTYDSGKTYNLNDIVQDSGNVYKSLQDNNTGNVVTNTSYWEDVTDNVIISNSADKLTTARTIGGVSFDGTTNIDLPGVNITGNQNTTGNAATATKLATPRTITIAGDQTGSASFDGSGDITITTSNVAANLLTDLKTVDGSGSGLDADLLDGQDFNNISQQFVNLSHGGATITMDDQTAPDGYGFRRIACNDGGGNWNFRSSSYFADGDKYAISGSGATNLVHNTNNNDASIQLKVAPKGTNAGDTITWAGVFSVTTLGVSFNNHTIWHADNDGSGSGLDADLLDGQQGSFYRNASNINAGTIGDAYLPATISSDITGNAATADNAVNTTKWDNGTQTTSTSAPSGGNDGDFWFQY